MDAVLCQIPTEVKDLSQLLGVLLAENLRLSAPSGTASAAESCLAQGHAPS